MTRTLALVLTLLALQLLLAFDTLGKAAID